MRDVTALNALFPVGATRPVGVDGTVLPLPATVSVEDGAIRTKCFRGGDTDLLHFELRALEVRGWGIGDLLRTLVRIAGVYSPAGPAGQPVTTVDVPLLPPEGGGAPGCWWQITPGLRLWHTGSGVRLFEVTRVLPVTARLSLPTVERLVQILVSAQVIDAEIERRKAKAVSGVYAELTPAPK